MNPVKIPLLSTQYSHIPVQYLLSEYVKSIGTHFRVKKGDITDINLLLEFFGESSKDYNKSVLVFSNLILSECENVTQYERGAITEYSLFDYIDSSSVHVIFIDSDHYHSLKVSQVIEKFVRDNLGFLTIVRLE